MNALGIPVDADDHHVKNPISSATSTSGRDQVKLAA